MQRGKNGRKMLNRHSVRSLITSQPIQVFKVERSKVKVAYLFRCCYNTLWFLCTYSDYSGPRGGVAASATLKISVMMMMMMMTWLTIRQNIRRLPERQSGSLNPKKFAGVLKCLVCLLIKAENDWCDVGRLWITIHRNYHLSSFMWRITWNKTN